MKSRLWVSNIIFNDNTSLDLNKDDIVVFVGPNNSGKSASLKEISKSIKSKADKRVILKNVTIEKEGDEQDLFKLLDNVATKSYDGGNLMYRASKFATYESNAKNIWSNYSKGVGELEPLFVNSLTTEQRLQAANPPKSIRLTTDAPQHPIHVLQKDDSLEAKFNDYFNQAFGTDLTLHRNAGSEVPLYVGEKPHLESGEDRLSRRYLIELEKLDVLHEQGDGMRGFVGVLLNAFVSQHSILLIDEPEAFLHPPQARLLGKMLAKDLPTDRQLFLATHSEDFLKGLLDANTNNLKIVRIQRDGAINKVRSLENSDIESIWKDSLLRHSNILGGLFHSKVIICESDSDCRFYSAILSSLYDNTNSIAPDYLFVHCGGKARIPIVIKALKKLGVPLLVIPDFDVLNDINPLKEIFEDLGGSWTDIEKDWKIVKTKIEEKRPELLTSDLKQEIEVIFSNTPDRIFPTQKIKDIGNLLKRASAWSEAKNSGKSFIPNGDATHAYNKMQLKLKEKGVLIVEVGQLESFVKSIGNHGPKWVSEVLVKDLKTDVELEPAKEFVKQFTS